MIDEPIIHTHDQHHPSGSCNYIYVVAEEAALRVFSALSRSLLFRIFLRSRTDLGVISQYSSSSKYSRACSRDIARGVFILTVSSLFADRILFTCFSLQMFTTISLSRECSPTIMPS